MYATRALKQLLQHQKAAATGFFFNVARGAVCGFGPCPVGRQRAALLRLPRQHGGVHRSPQPPRPHHGQGGEVLHVFDIQIVQSSIHTTRHDARVRVCATCLLVEYRAHDGVYSSLSGARVDVRSRVFQSVPIKRATTEALNRVSSEKGGGGGCGGGGGGGGGGGLYMLSHLCV